MTACARPGYLPKIQFQNPAISGDPDGWDGCQAYAGAMAADFDTCGSVDLTGRQVRLLTDEPHPDPKSPGLNLRQIDDALNRYGVDLEVRYRLPWDDFVRRINKGEGAVLDGATGPLLTTKFRSTYGDINHAMFVPPGWGAMDPAADGHRSYVHRYDGQPYPKDLLRRFAGHLALTYVNGKPIRLGVGYVYAAFTRDRRSTWTWAPARLTRFRVYQCDEGTHRIIGRHWAKPTSKAPHTCTPPRLYRDPTTGTSRSLVRMLAGEFAGGYVNSVHAKEVP